MTENKFEPIKYENEVPVNGVPIQWLTMIRLFDPYLPQFPMINVHIFKEERIYGFPEINRTLIKGLKDFLK